MACLRVALVVWACITVCYAGSENEKVNYGGRFCSSESMCDQCVTDIHHLGTAVDARIGQLFNGQAFNSLNMMSSNMVKVGQTVSNVNISIGSRKTIVVNQLETYRTSILYTLNSLRIKIDNARPDATGLIQTVTVIHQMQQEFHVAMMDLVKFMNEIILEIKNPKDIVNKVTLVNVAIDEVYSIVINTGRGADTITRIRESVGHLNKLMASVQVIVSSMKDIEQVMVTFVNIENRVRNSLQTVNGNQVNMYQRVEVLINDVTKQNTEIYNQIQSFKSLFVRVQNLIQQLSQSVTSITSRVVSFRQSMTVLQANLIVINDEIQIVQTSTTDFISTSKKLFEYISIMRTESVTTVKNFMSIEGEIEKFKDEVHEYIRKEKIAIAALIGSFDTITSLQTRNTAQLETFINLLKTDTVQAAKDSAKYKLLVSSTMQKTVKLQTTMSSALAMLKNMANGCKCLSTAVGKCDFACTQNGPLVCGSDGRTYANECELRRAACQQETVITVDRSGNCGIPRPTLPPTPAPTTPKPTTTPAPTPAPCSRLCIRRYAPVCGSDGKTYNSECDIKIYNCLYKMFITVKYAGKCRPTKPTPAPCEKLCVRLYRPVCGSDEKTYDSECDLKIYNCRFKTVVMVKYPGKCRPVTPKPEPTPAPCTSLCVKRYAPVCGSDGKTYNSECDITILNCRYKMFITVKYTGECRPVTPKPNQCMSLCTPSGGQVCGSDGKTYSTQCNLLIMACLSKSSVKVASNGPCKPVTPKPTCFNMCTPSGGQVCGTDGVTYATHCNLMIMACVSKTSVSFASSGPCKPVTPKPNNCFNLCTPSGGQVCGNDGKTYSTQCNLMITVCLSKTPISMAYYGPCKPKPTPSPCLALCQLPQVGKQLCGSDGNNYGSSCALIRYNCLNKKNVLNSYLGPCKPKPTPSPCLSLCTPSGGKVCASNGVTYSTFCAMKIQSCLTKVAFSFKSSGACSPAIPGTCNPGFMKIAGISGCFFIQKPSGTIGQEAALTDCNSLGASLISFSTDAEYEVMRQYVYKTTKYHRRRNYWTAGREISPSTTQWVWFTTKQAITLTTSWYKNRPKREDTCASMYGTKKFKMVDVNCLEKHLGDKYGWICRHS